MWTGVNTFKSGLLNRRILFHSHHFVSSSDEYGNSSGVLTFFNHQHPLFCCSENKFSYAACFTQLFCCEFFKSGYNTSSSCNGNQLKDFAKYNSPFYVCSCRLYRNFLKSFITGLLSDLVVVIVPA